MEILSRSYGHPDVVALVERLQAEYVRLFGGPAEEVPDEQFTPPAGDFGVGYDAGIAVVMGGWRHLGGGRAELKRMFVPEEHRGRGYSRAILAWLEDGAVARGATEMVLETSHRLGAALELYRSVGYTDVGPFGHYVEEPHTAYLGVSLPRPVARPQSPA